MTARRCLTGSTILLIATIGSLAQTVRPPDTATPNIMHLKDTKGSGKADQRTPLYEGFATQNPQLRVSHPNLGIDNWIYVANGLRGGQVKKSPGAAAAGPEKPINISGRDFRF